MPTSRTLSFQDNCDGIDFEAVANLLRDAGMAQHPAEMRRAAFTHSTRVLFVFENGALVGCGRMLTDKAYQAVMYDIAVHPKCQGRQLGRTIVERLLDGLDGYNVILYANSGKEDFYRKFGFRKLLTGMARFRDPSRMSTMGFTE